MNILNINSDVSVEQAVKIFDQLWFLMAKQTF